MKGPSDKDLREHQDPLLQGAGYDVANFNRFADLYQLPREPLKQSGRGPGHTAVTAGQVSKVKTEKGELTLAWGYTFESKRGKVEVKTFVTVERELDMVHLTHDIASDAWVLRAMVRDSGKLSKLLEDYDIKDGEGSVELKKSRYLLATRDLIEYFHKRRERYLED